MKDNILKKWSIALIPAVIITLSDIISKIWMIKFMHGRKVFEIFEFFNLVSVYNKGISFSMLSSGEEGTKIALICISIIISLLIIFWIKKETSFFTVFSLGVILGGALGNLIDRICNGAVFDFLDFHVGRYHWPAFNIADAAIVSGVFILLLLFLKEAMTGKNTT